jgi:hypothetical protein
MDIHGVLEIFPLKMLLDCDAEVLVAGSEFAFPMDDNGLYRALHVLQPWSTYLEWPESLWLGLSEPTVAQGAVSSQVLGF